MRSKFSVRPKTGHLRSRVYHGYELGRYNDDDFVYTLNAVPVVTAARLNRIRRVGQRRDHRRKLELKPFSGGKLVKRPVVGMSLDAVYLGKRKSSGFETPTKVQEVSGKRRVVFDAGTKRFRFK